MMRCPLCSSEHVLSVLKKPNTYFSDGKTSIDLEVGLCRECAYIFQSSAYCGEYDTKVASLYRNYRMSDNFEFPRRDSKSIESLEFICKNIELSSNSDILEIGSDRGDFLCMLRERSGANIVGIEPNSEQVVYMPTVRGYFGKESFSSKFDFVVLKHTLEHIKYPKNFMQDVFSCVKEGGYVYVEVPSFDICKKYLLDDFTAEHVSYFSEGVILEMFSNHEVIAIDNSHFLRIIVKNSSPSSIRNGANIPDESFDDKSFFSEISSRNAKLEELIVKHTQGGGIAVFYGVGLYYRILMGGLKDKVMLEKCFFYDDGFSEEIEPLFSIKRINFKESQDEDVIAIFCSNDYRVQDEMNTKFASLMERYLPLYFCRTNPNTYLRAS